MIRRAALAAAALALLSGCPAKPPVIRPSEPAARPLPIPLQAPAGHDEPALAGIVHVVRRGETLYRIARAYGIDPADLMETNGIADPRNVAVGTELFVPGASAPAEVTPYPGPMPAGPAPAAPPAARPSPAVASAAPAPPAARAPAAGRAEIVAAPPREPDDGPPIVRQGAPSRLGWPLKGVLYGRYGVRAGQRHDGIDIAAPEGTPVLAAADGSVIYAGEQAGYGAVVILRHDGGLVTLYAHNSEVLVKEGARVGRGQPIARVGQTGRTTGPHLHFEVREGTRPRNPLIFLP
ncbi:LysM peptidoglycan-binding domain-containing M23 family metallopeptidase [Anaeromyxobacter sp. Red801]|uniref:LysM peptidoglycan-binding domain-containing M23 family metallopeptidase n=1 Tax=Anaeromyxobacter sp. Red801 TaxID=3411632 RepID=UPI003BA11178